MKVWIVPSEVSELDITESVFGLLETFHGPMTFHASKEPCPILNPSLTFWGKTKRRKTKLDYDKKVFREEVNYSIAPSMMEEPKVQKTFEWDEIFKACKRYRKTHHIPEEDFIILGTGHDNVPAWFSCFDPDGSRNAFVHLDDWDHYIKANKKFPVAYSVAEMILQQMMYSKIGNLWEQIHREPMGCMNDLCESKKDVQLKLRTADICGDCIGLMERAEIPPLYIDQALRIFGGIRTQMLFSEGFRRNVPPGKMHIDEDGKIILTDYGNMRIAMPKQETSLYLLFLETPEGIILNDLPRHKDRLFNIYKNISGIADLRSMSDSIEILVNQNSVINQKISKIKKAFEDKLGKENARHYIISGNPAEAYGITLDRGLVKNGERVN